MEVLWFIGALATLVLFAGLVWAIDIIRNRRPLDSAELFALSKKRQRNAALHAYQFSMTPTSANPDDKRSMDAKGEFVSWGLSYAETPARIAGLMKWKKHEWIVIAFIKEFQVSHLWWNKGLDGRSVSLRLQDHSLKEAVRMFQPDSIAVLHNHPNPDPSRYRASDPSAVDLESASAADEDFAGSRISLLEFVCERGVPHLYYASFDEQVIPIEPIVVDLRQRNGKGVLANYSLRRELRRKTGAEQVAGCMRHQLLKM